MFIVTTNEQNIRDIIKKIDINFGYPDQYTQTWAEPKKAYGQDFWFILEPSINFQVGINDIDYTIYNRIPKDWYPLES